MASMTGDTPILVSGATGAQGGAVARALLAHGLKVRAMVRDTSAAGAAELRRLGAETVATSFEDEAALDRALAGCGTAFSVQLAPSPADPDKERRQAKLFIDAAQRAGVAHMIHSSVSNTGDFQGMPGWTEGRWERNYWLSKADAEAIVRDAGFAAHTLLRPAFMMENFAEPKAAFMFPDLRRGRISTAVEPDTRIALVAADDIGAAALAALLQPDRFAEPIELAGDHCTLPEIAALIASAKGMPVIAETLGADELVARGQHDGWVQTQAWLNGGGYPARPAEMLAHGLQPTGMAQWVAAHAGAIIIGPQG